MKHNLFTLNNYLFERHALNLFCLFLFLTPIKLSFSYACFFPLMLSGLGYLISNKKIGEFFLASPKISAYWVFFIISLFASASFGLEPLKSYRKLLELTFYSSSVIVFYQLLKLDNLRPLLFLIAGQAISSFYSILEFFDPQTFRQLFVGAVSESGQISISIFLAFACLVSVFTCKPNKSWKWLVLSELVLIFMALILNMKRGPLIGVALGGVMLFVAYRPKFLFIFCPLIVLPFIVIESARQRLFASLDHFLISGGRYDIWEIGIELAGRLPLGIGYANSKHLQDFSNVIPANLKHFHSNYLNILVEGGVLSLLLFLCFLISLIYIGYKKWREQKDSRDMLLLACLVGLISWMTAGLVEYNFGDSEVMLIVYVVISYICLRTSELSRHDQGIVFTPHNFN